MKAYKIFLGRKEIDKIFLSDKNTDSREEIKKSLVNHDGYDPAIRVVKEWDKKPAGSTVVGKEGITDVIFRAIKSGDFKNDVEAFFPEIPETAGQPHKTVLCYGHIGQHSAASLDYYRDKTRPASPGEAANLKRELESFGYVLSVMVRMTTKHRAAWEQAIREQEK
jgi:hypothetical protein